MNFEQFFDLTSIRLIFKYENKEGIEKEYDQPATLIELKDYRLVTGHNPRDLAIGITTKPLPEGDLPLNRLHSLVIYVTMLDGITVAVGIHNNEYPTVDWFKENAYIPLNNSKSDFIKTALATYGWYWFDQQSALEVSELGDNPMFKKGVKAAREGLIFSTWFIGMLDKQKIREEMVLQRGMSKENWDKIINNEVVGLPVSLVAQAADVLDVSLDAMVKLLQDEGILNREEKKHDAGVQPQTEVPEDAPGARDVPNDSVPLEAKPAGR